MLEILFFHRTEKAVGEIFELQNMVKFCNIRKFCLFIQTLLTFGEFSSDIAA
jgi:hypothetical protein